MTNTNTQAVQTTPRQTAAALPKTVKSWLTSDWFKTQVALCLPKHLTPERFCRIALTALTRVPRLTECTPETVIKAMLTCSELGIEPDGRRAHLIPFRNTKANNVECQLIIDYKGLVELAKRSGDVSSITAQIVCEKDTFTWDTGEVHHVINFAQPRGEMYAAYAVIKFKDGTEQADVMTKAEIDAIRKRSKAANDGPWVTDYHEMARKTVFRRASKWITLSPEVADALDRDADTVPALNLVAEGPATLLAVPEIEPEPTHTIDLPPENQNAPETKPEAKSNGKKATKQQKGDSEPKPEMTPQSQLLAVVVEAGFKFQDLVEWGKESGNIPDADSLPDAESIPAKIAQRLLLARVGLVDGLKRMAALKGPVTP